MLIVLTVGLLSLMAGGGEPLFFDTNDTGLPPANVPTIKPWKVVPLDPDYGGQWVLAADLNADGKVEFVACENHNVGDVHYTSTAVACDLDGTVLWRWGDPNLGRKEWHHDVALVTTTAVYIFRNESGVKPAHRVGLGTEFNFTLY